MEIFDVKCPSQDHHPGVVSTREGLDVDCPACREEGRKSDLDLGLWDEVIAPFDEGIGGILRNGTTTGKD